MKSPEPGNKAQRKVEYKNYHAKLWGKLLQKIMNENYQLVYQSRGKCKIYRDTGVSKNCTIYNDLIQ